MLRLNVLIVSGSHIIRLGLSKGLRELNSQSRIMLATDWEAARNILEYRQCSIIFADEEIIDSWQPNKFRIKGNQQLIAIIYSKDKVATTNSISLFFTPQDLAEKLSSLFLLGSKHEETPLNDISKRELEIVRLISLGLSNREIAEKLNLSLHTVTTHRKNISRKLKIKTTAGLTVYAS